MNDRIRNLLLQYDFSKSSDPYVYWSSHISTLLVRDAPRTSDISLIAGSHSFELHKFLLSSRTPYFRKKLEAQPDTTIWNVAASVPVEAMHIVLRYVYLGDLPRDLVPPGSQVSEEEVAKGLDKISKQLEVEHLWEDFTAGNDRRLARQRYQDEVGRAMNQLTGFFEENVLGHKMIVDTERVNEVKWKHDNSIFADVLLRADELTDEQDEQANSHQDTNDQSIPVGPAAANNHDSKPRKSVLYPAHKAMLIRSEYFNAMFSGDFVESKNTEHLRIVTVDCVPKVLELVLTFLYTETAVCPLEYALDLLYAADMLFLDSLKSKAAQAISTLGSGNSKVVVDRTLNVVEVEPINVYDVIHAAWDLRVQRLEEFGARYLADRLEDYIDDPDFQELIRESADRLQRREETDTIELLDDVRYYLSERFRLRFEDQGIDEMLDEDGELLAEAAAQLADAAATQPEGKPVPAVAETVVASKMPTQPAAGGEQQAPEEEAVVTLDGETAEDEFASDAINYQILLGKIDAMLDRLKLDA